jgi:hypothetical protein
MAARTLHVRCATWDQVEVFTTRKLRMGRVLSMKVPFTAKVGAEITLVLDLPNDEAVSINGSIQKCSPIDGDATRTWVEIDLVGFTDEVKKHLSTLVKHQGAPAPAPAPQPPPPARRPVTQIGEDLPADERELFQRLSGELRRMRQASVHEVLGVTANAGPNDVRARWKELIRRHHPDLVARRGAPAITHLAEELTILANRAYDRMRARLVADGRGTTAGPGIAAAPGWLVGFDDIQSGGDGPSLAKRSQRGERAPSNPPLDTLGGDSASAPSRPTASGQGSEAFEQRARVSLGQGDANTAREVLAAALVVYPRSKPLRSLYYVATALAALVDGEVMLATSQLETALAHHEQCIEAAKMLEHIRKHGSAKPEEFRRLFR